jgi:murein DD-endopeptidase MepM/ murein hydrolase activator NlpD
VPWGPGHRGVDLGGQPGDPVLAIADGTVVFAGYLVDRPVISVDHPGGLRSTYEPVDPLVTPGQLVHRGDVLGHLLPGHPECTAAPACLHWGIRRGDNYLDPLILVSAHHVRLLPWLSG